MKFVANHHVVKVVLFVVFQSLNLNVLNSTGSKLKKEREERLIVRSLNNLV